MRTTLVNQVQTVCCECGRARVGNRWLSRSEVDLGNVQLTHGYCPPCFDRALMALARIPVDHSVLSPSRVGVAGS